MYTVTSGAGPRAVGMERGRLAVNDNERTPAPLTGLESHGGASEGIKGGVTTVEDERGPGLEF